MSMISQMLTVSYPAVIAERKKAANQWEASAFMSKWDELGGIKRISFGPTIEVPLDYRANPSATFLDSDLQAVSTDKTEVLGGALFTPAQLSVAMVWSKMQEATSSSENQKVALVSSLIANGVASHDDLLEQAWFATSTSGFLGLLTHCPTSGQGSDGGISAVTEAWWRSQAASYVDETDLEAALTTCYYACAKGSGSMLLPKVLVSNGAARALFAGTQSAKQQWSSTSIKSGVTSLMFNNADWVFSPYGTTTVYMLNPSNLQLCVSREFWMEQEETQPFPAQNGYIKKIYSACQTVVTNRSRLGCVYVAS